jgi:hypothetical protein
MVVFPILKQNMHSFRELRGMSWFGRVITLFDPDLYQNAQNEGKSELED